MNDLLKNWKEELLSGAKRDCPQALHVFEELAKNIETLLAEQRAKERAKIIQIAEGMKFDPHKMKADVDREHGNERHGFDTALHCFPHNQALDDLISAIKTLEI